MNNKNDKNDKYRMINALKIHKIMLSITCTWPKENDTLLYRIIMIVWGFIALVYILLMYTESFKNLDNITEATSVLQFATPLTSYYFKFIAFVYNRNLFIDMIKLLNEDIFYKHEEKLNVYIGKAIKLSEIITKLFATATTSFGLIYVLLPLVNGTNYPTPLSMDFGNLRPLIYFIQVAGVAQAGINNSAIDCLCLTLLTLGACQFDVLIKKIKKVRQYAVEEIKVKFHEDYDGNDLTFVDKVDENVEKRLKNAVQHHVALIKFLQLFEDIFSFGLLMQFLTSVSSIAASGFSLLVVPPTVMEFSKTILLFGLLLSEIFIYCYFSDNVMTKSTQIADACYFSEWYRYHPKMRKILMIIIQRSQKPVTITIMKFAVFSLQLFATILRMSYSYFALLLRMTSKDD